MSSSVGTSWSSCAGVVSSSGSIRRPHGAARRTRHPAWIRPRDSPARRTTDHPVRQRRPTRARSAPARRDRCLSTKTAALRGLMELGGLEPPTSWVRSSARRSSLAVMGDGVALERERLLLLAMLSTAPASPMFPLGSRADATMTVEANAAARVSSTSSQTVVRPARAVARRGGSAPGLDV